jgi:myosin heavy subunit
LHGNKIDQKKYNLDTDDHHYHYLNQEGCSFEAGEMDDAEEGDLTFDAMKTLGWSQDEIDDIFTILSGILMLGNIEFEPKPAKKEECQLIAGDSNKKMLSNLGGLWKIGEEVC